MPKTIALFILIITSLCSFDSTAQQVEWIKNLTGKSYNHFMDCATDSKGNVIALALYGNEDFVFNPELPITPSHKDYGSTQIITKYSPNGELLWVRSLEINTAYHYLFVEVDDMDNIYVSGPMDTTVSIDGLSVLRDRKSRFQHYLLKLNHAGNAQWLTYLEDVGDMWIEDGDLYLFTASGFYNGQVLPKKVFDSISYAPSFIKINRDNGEMLKPYYLQGFGIDWQNNSYLLSTYNNLCLMRYSYDSRYDTIFPNHPVNNMLDKIGTSRLAIFDINSKKIIKQKIFDDSWIASHTNHKNGDILMFRTGSSSGKRSPFQFDDLILNKDSNYKFTYLALYDKDLNRKWIKTFDSANSFGGRVFFDFESNVFYYDIVTTALYDTYTFKKIDTKGTETTLDLAIGREHTYTHFEHYNTSFDALGNLYYSSATTDSAYYFGDSVIYNQSNTTTGSPWPFAPLKTDGFLAKINTSQLEEKLIAYQQKIIAYPNPSLSTFNIILDPTFYNEYPELIIYNMSGAIVHREKNIDQVHTINCSKWAKGLYQLQLKTGTEIVTESVVVQ